jgi:hypothetical protein
VTVREFRVARPERAWQNSCYHDHALRKASGRATHRFACACLKIFAPLKFFSFCRGAKFGEFRLTLPAQVRCWLAVGKWQWGEMV